MDDEERKAAMARLESTKLYLAGIAEEYKTLRDESKQASINMLAILQIGAAFLGALMAGAGTQWDKATGLVPLILLILVPMFAAISMMMWLGEARRLKRVGDYLCLVESKYALALKGVVDVSVLEAEWMAIRGPMERSLRFRVGAARADPLAWERWLRAARVESGVRAVLKAIFKPSSDTTGALLTSGHDAVLYAIRMSFFPLFMLVSIALGWFHLFVVKTNAFGARGYWFIIVAALTVLSLSLRLAFQLAKVLEQPPLEIFDGTRPDQQSRQ